MQPDAQNPGIYYVVGSSINFLEQVTRGNGDFKQLLSQAKRKTEITQDEIRDSYTKSPDTVRVFSNKEDATHYALSLQQFQARADSGIFPEGKDIIGSPLIFEATTIAINTIEKLEAKSEKITILFPADSRKAKHEDMHTEIHYYQLNKDMVTINLSTPSYPEPIYDREFLLGKFPKFPTHIIQANEQKVANPQVTPSKLECRII